MPIAQSFQRSLQNTNFIGIENFETKESDTETQGFLMFEAGTETETKRC